MQKDFWTNIFENSIRQIILIVVLMVGLWLKLQMDIVKLIWAKAKLKVWKARSIMKHFRKKNLFEFICFCILFFIYLLIDWLIIFNQIFFLVEKVQPPPPKKLAPPNPHFRFTPPPLYFLKSSTSDFFQNFQNPLTPRK